jgi:hypothetical protein
MTPRPLARLRTLCLELPEEILRDGYRLVAPQRLRIVLDQLAR